MKNLAAAIKILKAGGVIAFPTDTVYGLGAMLKNKAAIAKIYQLKKRPRHKPLQVLVTSPKEALQLGKFSKSARLLAEENWPGAMTIIVPKRRTVPAFVTGNKKTVGLRVPEHKLALALLKLTGPLAATSANLSEEKPALNAREVKKQLKGVDYILSGKVRSGIASTVIDTTAGFKILRA